jgi:hypothetical protein
MEETITWITDHHAGGLASIAGVIISVVGPAEYDLNGTGEPSNLRSLHGNTLGRPKCH